MRRGLVIAVAGSAALLSACSVTGRREAPPALPPPVTQPLPPPSTHKPPDVDSVPDAIPRDEPRSKRGNAPFYTVLCKRYVLLPTAEG